MRNKTLTLVVTAACLISSIAMAQQTPAPAPTPVATPSANPNQAPGYDQKSSAAFDAKHPRRAEVLNRDANEINKNKAAAANGQITARQEHKLNREDAAIRRQEQKDARANGGKITKGEQAKLNHEENRVNHQRAHDEKIDANPK